ILRWRRFRTILLEAAVSDARDREVNSVVDDELERLMQEQWEREPHFGPEQIQQELLEQIQQEIERRRRESEQQKPEQELKPGPQPEPKPKPELPWQVLKERIENNPAVIKKLENVRTLAETNLDMDV